MLLGLPRRSAALAAAAIVLTGTLSSCGFDLATNSVNTISSGINDQDGEVDILGAVIISGAPDSGVFVATLSNANPAVAISLTGLAGDVAPAGSLEPVKVGSQGSVSLFQTGGVPLSGDIGLGDFVSVDLTFDSGQTSTLNIPVVRPCFEYDPAKFPNLDLPSASEGGSAAESAAEEAPTEESAGESVGESAEGEEGPVTQETDPYSCIPTEQVPPHGGEEG
ncbi:MAG: hypothetical protein WB471_04470 [Nocardioides sp.]